MRGQCELHYPEKHGFIGGEISVSYEDFTQIYLRTIEQAEDRRRRDAERERRRVESVNDFKRTSVADLGRKISNIEDNVIRHEILSALTVLENSLLSDSSASRWRSIGEVRDAQEDIRRRLYQAEIDMKREKQIKLRIADTISKFADDGSFDDLPELKTLYDSLRENIEKTQSNQSQPGRISALCGLERDLDEVKKRVEYAGKIDYAAFTEKAADLTEFITTLTQKKNAEAAGIRDEITSYFSYLSDFDESMAGAVREYYDEALDCDDIGYLDNLRTRIHRTYTDVRRATELTVFFRQELADSLPILRAIADAAPLVKKIVKMIDPLEHKYIARDDYFPIRKEIAHCLRRETDGKIFAKIAAVTMETLTALGYNLMKDAAAQSYAPDGTLYYDAPTDDYRVGLRIGVDGHIRSKVVRLEDNQEVSGETDEKLAKTWCGHMKILHGAFETVGFDLENIERKEPEKSTILEPTEDKRKNALKNLRRKINNEEQKKLARHQMR
jgi:hypothetical protein